MENSQRRSSESKVVDMNILYIDSTDKEIIIKININSRKASIKKISPSHAQIILPLIEELLEKNNLTTKNIHAIEINIGPGSFTGLRVGVTIANTLGYSLKIPVNGKRIDKGEIVEPVYNP
jgi:tRNA threonylcarbamoyladenosine biosynthesis protein TsaB